MFVLTNGIQQIPQFNNIEKTRLQKNHVNIFVQATENGVLINCAKPECKITIFTK